MNTLKKMLPYLLTNIIAFYLLPLAGKSTGVFMLILLVLLPVACFLSALFYSLRHSVHPGFAPLVALLFFPTLFLYYNSSAWVYIPAYFLIALAGNGLGALLRKYLKNEKRQPRR